MTDLDIEVVAGGELFPVTVPDAERHLVRDVTRQMALALLDDDDPGVQLLSGRLGRILDGDETLVGAGIRDGDTLVLELSAAGIGETIAGDDFADDAPTIVTRVPTAGAPSPPTPQRTVWQAVPGSTPAGLTPPPPPPAPSRGRLVAGVLVGVAVVLSLAGLASAYVLTRDDEGQGVATTAGRKTVTVPPETVTRTQVETTVVTAPDDPPDDEGVPTTSEGTEAGGLNSAETLDVVQLGSFRQQGNAEREAERLRDEGLDAQVIDSDATEELRAGYHVVYAGPYADQAEIRRVIAAAADAGVKGARSRPLTLRP